MIVSDKNVSDALAYLAIDPHPIALARKDAVDAENESKRIYAELYLKTEGTVKERESRVETFEAYHDAKDAEAEAILDLERHKARARAADMLIEVWRSENANVRAAERVR
jgi:hypothetical protein